ncbi:potassium channel family protein [Streptomyces sp. NPDC006879]|uniref:potassium channel family protein n=1 Tax=Streptomyces sp. NPDC006879 TaxID=3364767 RepID=UPI00367BF418
MQWLVTVAGAAMVLLILRDVFHTLWHPTRHGGLSRLVMSAFWRVSFASGSRHRASGLAGPLAMVTVGALWALTVVAGWALIYWPQLPDGFGYANGLRPAEHAGPLDAVYISLVTVSTLGLGDIAPTEGWLRVLAPLEGLVGFALLTAMVAWTLGIYPALARRRALALRLCQLSRARGDAAPADAAAGVDLLGEVAALLAVVTVDFLQYAESYYFYDGDDRTSLAGHLQYAQDLAERGALAQSQEVRNAAAVLHTALDDLADILDERFLHTGGPTRLTLEAFANDHGRRAGAGHSIKG